MSEKPRAFDVGGEAGEMASRSIEFQDCSTQCYMQSGTFICVWTEEGLPGVHFL